MITTPERELTIPSEQEIRQIKELQEFLRKQSMQPARLMGHDGEIVEMPELIYKMLCRIVPLMALGRTIGLVPLHQELTTQQAADLLNISRPSLIKLLSAGEIPYHTLERGHRRLRFADVMAYKERRSVMRRTGLAEMAAIGEKYGANEADADDVRFELDADDMHDERASSS